MLTLVHVTALYQNVTNVTIVFIDSCNLNLLYKAAAQCLVFIYFSILSAPNNKLSGTHEYKRLAYLIVVFCEIEILHFISLVSKSGMNESGYVCLIIDFTKG